MIVIELISVILLFLFLRRFAFPSLIKAMQDRAHRIQSDLDTAEATRREAEELKAHLEQEVKEIKRRAEETLARAVKEAQDEKRSILEESHRESKRILAEAEAEIARQRRVMMQEVRQQVVELSLDVAGRVIHEHMNQETDRKLVHEFIDRIGVPQ
jgi:F-type H+-transporting ATPase subunit b